MPDSTAPDAAERGSASELVKLLLSWVFVGIPAVWGIWHVTRDAIRLFQ